MSFKSWWHRLWCGKWTANRLLSRKWCLTLGVIVAAIIADVAGHAFESETADLLRYVLVAYLAVQGALDWGTGRAQKQQKHQQEQPDDGGDV